jgi:hypothetical protein
MTNQELVKKIKELLNTDADLDFLLVLKKKDLEKLVACIRGRLDQTVRCDTAEPGNERRPYHVKRSEDSESGNCQDQQERS